MNKTYFQLRLKDIKTSQEEELSDLCFSFGALGVSENIPLSEDTLDKPILVNLMTKSLDVYFETVPSSDFYSKLSQHVSLEQIENLEFENKDWLEEWKKGYKAFALIENYWVVPSWIKAPENVIPIFIDPGMAFGTGTHQTTQLCAELIFDVLKNQKINSMIDVGTGTSILSMLASKLGVTKIIGTEIDTESVITAKENLTINKISSIEVIEAELSAIEGIFDLTVSNIIDGVLLDLKSDLLRVTNKNGYLVLSGILEERDTNFIKQFLASTNLQVLKRLQKDEWIGYLLKKQ